MKVPHVIAEIVSEFSGFQHTPDFKASRSTGNFAEDPEAEHQNLSGATSSDSHHPPEHHGHSLYFGKHLKIPHNHSHPPSIAEEHHDPDTHSNHSGHSAKHGKHHGPLAHFANLFHFGHHHHDHEDSHSKPASGASTPARKNSNSSLCPHQKHSIHITVGADEVPTICATPPNEPNHPHFVKNLNSPCISRVASSSSLREKLYKIKRTTSSDSETDFPEKKCSVASYRVVGLGEH